jgi:hypothetical protein
MKLAELKTILSQNPQKHLRFILPDGSNVPPHAHVTEVARIDKRFVDCGGTFRTESFCRLQTWFADDVDHRLDAAKLLKILGKAASFLETDDIEVDVEHEAPVISQFPVLAVEPQNDVLLIKLGSRNTACLAMDKCGVPPTQSISFKPIPSFAKAARCC